MSNMITMTRTQEKMLITKSKVGWASYYACMERFNDLTHFVYTLQQRNRQLRESLNNPHLDLTDLDISFLKTQFIEMYDKLKEYSECPVCLELIKKDTAKLGNCGHLVCITCYDSMDKCPICRKKYWKPKPTNSQL